MLTDLGYEPTHPEYKKFLGYMKVESIDRITKDQFQKAVKAIEAKKAAKGAGK
jgi:hypothetical protein